MSYEYTNPLSIENLRHKCDPALFSFNSTEDIVPLENLMGQQRAIEALSFGVGIDSRGFNMFVLGASGSGRHTAVRAFLEKEAQSRPKPLDWVYVNNFRENHKPVAISLPAGQGVKLSKQMDRLIADLLTAIPSMFESDEYRNRRRVLDASIEEAQDQAFSDLKVKAGEQDIGILRTPMGFSLAPLKDGKTIKPEVFNVLPEEERKVIEEKINLLQKELEDVLHQLPQLQKDYMEKVRALNSEFAELVVDLSMKDLLSLYAGQQPVSHYLQEIRTDIIDKVEVFLASKNGQEGSDFAVSLGDVTANPFFRRYKINVLVSSVDEENCEAVEGAPVIFEDHPTLANLLGRVEHVSQQGALMTDFTLIKAGALHRANGGYLVLDARRVLTEPFAWEALKRSLRSGCITIRSAADQLGVASTISLEPDPVPMSVKVVLVGDRTLFYLLVNLDPDFREIFKINVDFDEDIERSKETVQLYAQLLRTLVDKEKTRHLTRDAVAVIIEEASRQCDDAEKLSLKVGVISDLLHEANQWASLRGQDIIHGEDVEKAISKRAYRSDRVREKSIEHISRDTILIDTDGEAVGQINGLAVLSLGNFRFGKPSRITARVRMGTGKVIDIEREVELGGPLHSKGVLILSSYLASHYALDEPVSLWASLVFEQSYGGVDGDSASSAELYALLSALSDKPVKQNYAVTGSVNQFGQVQAIGGVNEKVEGFFDVCHARGLTGGQGVLIPAANVKNLMLRKDVVEACAQGKFSVHAVSTIAQGVEILTGVPSGERGEDGEFPSGTINALVEGRLREFAKSRSSFGRKEDAETAQEV